MGIEKDGYYDLKASSLWSWTSRRPLAETFARYGQGKRIEQNAYKIVITQEANKDNVWLHPDQPTYRNLINGKIQVGDKFNSGGADQKEYILENKNDTFRVTKENSTWI